MIVAQLEREGSKMLLFVLEPGNLAKLETGKPIIKNLGDFLPECEGMKILIAYTPDIEWVAKEIVRTNDIAGSIDASLNRRPIYRESEEAEKLERADLWKDKK